MKPSLLIAVIAAAIPVTARAQVASIEVTPASGTIVAGKTLQLSATAKDASGNAVQGAQLLWLSGPFEIAAVDQKGLVRAFRPELMLAGIHWVCYPGSLTAFPFRLPG